MNQEIKETVPNPAFAVKILAVNPNKERARNWIKFSSVNLNYLTFYFIKPLWLLNSSQNDKLEAYSL